jgi:hypothetical protein
LSENKSERRLSLSHDAGYTEARGGGSRLLCVLFVLWLGFVVKIL